MRRGASPAHEHSRKRPRLAIHVSLVTFVLSFGVTGALAQSTGAAGGGPSIASTEASVSIEQAEAFVRDVYLDPEIDNLDLFAERTYASDVLYYGKRVSRSDVAADKRRWFDRWQSWSVEVVPGSLLLNPLDAARTQVSFRTTYKWTPKSGTKTLQGLAQVTLVLNRADGSLRISTETSSPLQ